MITEKETGETGTLKNPEPKVQEEQIQREKSKSVKFIYGCNGLSVIEAIYENYNELQVIANNSVLINQQFAKEMNQTQKDTVGELVAFIKEVVYKRVKDELINL